MKTTWANPKTVEQSWHLVDADKQTLGRMASEIATILMGKHKPIYTPFIDTGDYVVVKNAEKVLYTGTKARDKKYYRFTGYIGNLKERTLGEYLEKNPEEVIILAVKRMLPKTKLGRQMLSKLKVYKGDVNPHEAQFKCVKNSSASKEA